MRIDQYLMVPKICHVLLCLFARRAALSATGHPPWPLLQALLDLCAGCSHHCSAPAVKGTKYFAYCSLSALAGPPPTPPPSSPPRNCHMAAPCSHPGSTEWRISPISHPALPLRAVGLWVCYLTSPGHILSPCKKR